MRKFDVLLIHKGKKLAYRDLTGQKSIKLMKWLKDKNINCIAYTKASGIEAYLTLEQMIEVVL